MAKNREENKGRGRDIDRKKEAAEHRDGLTKDLSLLTKALQETNADSKTEGETRKVLEKVLSSHIQNLTSENKEVKQQSVASMKFILKELKTSNNTLLEDKEKFIDLYDKTIKASEKNNSQLKTLAKDLKKNIFGGIPTIGKFTSAVLSNSNPIIGAVASFGKEIRDYKKDLKERADKAKQAELEQIKEESKLFEENAKAVKEAADKNEKVAVESNKEKKKGEKKGEGPLVSRMEAVKVENIKQTALLEKLNTAWEPTGTTSSSLEPVAAVSSSDATAVGLERIEAQNDKLFGRIETLEVGNGNSVEAPSLQPIPKGQEPTTQEDDKVVNLLERMTDQNDQMIKIEEDGKRGEAKQSLEKVAADKKSKIPAAFKGSKGLENSLAKDGIMSMLTSIAGPMIGSFMGGLLPAMLGGLTKLMSGGGKLLGGIGKTLGLLKGVPVLGEIIMVVTAAFDFFDGFSNAAEILDKSEVTLYDKVVTGIASVVGGFVGIFDSILGLFGVKTEFGKMTTKWLAKYWSAIPDFLDSCLKWVTDAFKSFDFGAMGEAIVDKTKKAVSFIGDILLDILRNYVKMVTTFIPDALLPDALKKFMDGGKDKPKTGEVEAPASENGKNKYVEEYKQTTNDTEAATKAAEDKKATSSIVNAPSNNTVNAGTTNVFSAPLKTRNDDDSVTRYMGMLGAF